jgi:hypothetical protein
MQEGLQKIKEVIVQWQNFAEILLGETRSWWTDSGGSELVWSTTLDWEFAFAELDSDPFQFRHLKH